MRFIDGLNDRFWPLAHREFSDFPGNSTSAKHPKAAIGVAEF
jgi:hypothetical protein